MGGMFQSAGAKKGHFGEARESSIWMERERNGDAQEMKEKATVAPKHNQKNDKIVVFMYPSSLRRLFRSF